MRAGWLTPNSLHFYHLNFNTRKIFLQFLKNLWTSGNLAPHSSCHGKKSLKRSVPQHPDQHHKVNTARVAGSSGQFFCIAVALFWLLDGEGPIFPCWHSSIRSRWLNESVVKRLKPNFHGMSLKEQWHSHIALFCFGSPDSFNGYFELLSMKICRFSSLRRHLHTKWWKRALPLLE